MLYPTNIIVIEKGKFESIKESCKKIKDGIKRRVKYLLFDRTNIGQKILVKLHI